MANHHLIRRLRVDGGFLAGLEIELADGLNCFVGGRGTGKTTALEFLRFGLGLLPDARIHPQRRRALETLMEGNLAEGRLSLAMRTKAGVDYSAERGRSEAIIVRNALGQVVPILLDRDEIFSADVFSQNEIEEIASNSAAQLELLDRFDESANRRSERSIEDLLRALSTSAAELGRIDEAVSELQSQGAELAGIEERLRGLNQSSGPDGERLSHAHSAKATRLHEAQVPEAALLAVQGAARDAENLRKAFDSAHRTALGQVREGSDADPTAGIRRAVSAFQAALVSATSSIVAAAKEAEGAIAEARLELQRRHANDEAEYAALLAASQEHAQHAIEREGLQSALAAAQFASRERQAKMEAREALVGERAKLLERLSEARDERYARRRSVAAQLSAEVSSLRVSVRQSGNLEAYRDFVAEQLKGQRMKQGMVADRIVASLLPTELADMILEKDPEQLAERCGIEIERARRIIDAMYETGCAYELQTMDLADVPCIELRDGDTYKEASHLSTGQRCTVVLPILLRQSDRPLLIDQPEDNLDNAFVFETVVGALRAVKATRQLVFVTHNPNIPVLGDADRVFVFVSDGRQGSVLQKGTVDECKGSLERILEGGASAFLERMKRYGH